MLYVKLAASLYARAQDSAWTITKRAAEDEAPKRAGQFALIGLVLLNILLFIPALLYVSHLSTAQF
jgi:hypothetical protein